MGTELPEVGEFLYLFVTNLLTLRSELEFTTGK